MKTVNKWMIAGMLAMPMLASAQGAGHVGGGDPTASDFQDFINKIDTYLLSSEGKSEFPELKQPEFHNIIMQVKPVVKDERVYDSFGVAQACASHIEEGNRYFQCDVTRLPKIELNNQPTFYRITFHELLFQAGLELPISKEVPSDFKISSRLKLRLQTYQEWVPGKGDELAETLAQTGIACSTRGSEFDKNAYAFIWQPNGDYALVHQHLPKAQRDYGIQQYQTITRWQERVTNLKQSAAHFFGGDIVSTVLARGNSSDLLSSQYDGGIQYKYRGISHDDDKGARFNVYTITEIEKTPQFTRGSYTEFPLYLHLWDVKNIKKRDQYKTLTLICTGEAEWGHYQWIPVRKIFQQKDQKIFKENLIKKYNNPNLRK